MKILLGLVVLLVLALAAPRRGRRSRARGFFLVGGEFLLLGWALGDRGLGLLDDGTLVALEPLLTLGLGWIGLLVGLQFEWRLLRRTPVRLYLVGLAQGLAAGALVFLAAWPMLIVLFENSWRTGAAAAFLAAAVAGSSVQILGVSARGFRLDKDAPLPLYRFCAAVDTLLPLAALALLFGFHHEGALLGGIEPCWLPALGWAGRAVLLGAALGLVLAALIQNVREAGHRLLLLLGFLGFSGGLAGALDLPPLFVNFVAGMVTVNLLGHQRHTWELATASERPFYFIFLLLVGADWRLGSSWVLALAPALFALRLLGKAAGMRLASRLLPAPAGIGLRPGLALAGQGAVSVAMVASFQFQERDALAAAAYSLVLLGFLLSAALAPALARRALGREDAA
ncbi:MAG: hypothetical protein JW819_05020 [Candidatus Krumholzibacteriota bacterium]|nr:hypothetical protein [Candidatus Krumholzibacteriota bacterium]